MSSSLEINRKSLINQHTAGEEDVSRELYICGDCTSIWTLDHLRKHALLLSSSHSLALKGLRCWCWSNRFRHDTSFLCVFLLTQLLNAQEACIVLFPHSNLLRRHLALTTFFLVPYPNHPSWEKIVVVFSLFYFVPY